MSEFNLFSNIPPVGHLYFFYGLAFFLLGLFIVFKETKASDLKLAGSLWLLAGFGFAHGAHEWIELYLLLQGQHISVNEMFWLKLITVFVVIVSFLFLLQFGLKLIPSNNNYKKRLKGIPFILSLLWIIYLWNNGFSMDIQFLKKADILARNTFGFVGGLVTAYGLIIYSNEVKGLSLPVSKKLFYAGITFLFYGILAGIFPSHSIIPYIKIPVEVFRGVSAIFITYFIIRALNIFDIETKKKLELQLKRLAQHEKLASLGRLASGIAHEINNPLTNASLNVQTLKGKLENCCGYDDIFKKVDAIGRNVDRASNIARELLQFSRNTEPELKPININTVIEGAITLLQYKFKDITAHKTLSEIPNIMGDAVKLEQVFMNIIENSIHAMPEGGDICIESSHADGWAKIKIADSGIGIPKENLSKVFDPFFSTKDVGTGTGLGLSICYGIITQHNGDIDIESREGEGTVVTVKLPADDGK
ncbi:MAG: hypothetical protein HY752_08980 [Nitrospirae bacterium]|nr:hypothetical protein [Nitrospirota bacterium]